MKRAEIVVLVPALLLMSTVARAEDRGERLFRKNCTMCHIVGKRGGDIGPELTHIASRMQLSAMREKIESPRKSAPSTSMPAFKTLPRQDLDDLLAYLKTLK